MAPRRTLWLTLRESFALLSLFLHPSKSRAPAVYDLLAAHNNLADRSLYLNLGYWEEAESYDAACEALAEQLGLEAGLGPEDEVLDVGFGFADQDRYWLDRFGPRRITGINVTRSQVEAARARHPDPRLVLEVASATAMPFAAASFDKVLALESAFHFDTREAFLAEAFRVLRPGGRLAIADVVPLTAPRGLRAALEGWVGRSFWQIPKVNMYPPEVYAEKLSLAGFTEVRMRSIGAHVFAPFKAYAQRRVRDPDIEARVHPFLRAAWAAPHRGFAKFDYLIATASKPR